MNFSHSKKNFLHFLTQVFPPPKILQMEAVGVDLSDSAVRYIELGRHKKKAFVKNFGEYRLSPGVITSGFINKPSEVIDVLSKIRKKTGNPFASVSLPEEKAYLFHTQTPVLPPKELFEAVGFRLEENVPLSLKDAIYDIDILRDGGDSEHLNVMVSVIPSKVSETYADIFKSAGFLPIRFEISSQAIGRAVSPKNDESCLILNFADAKTSLSIVNNGIVFFSSTLPLGSFLLDEMIAKKFKVSMKEVPDIKAEIVTEGKQNMEFFIEMMESFSPVRSEISKLITYWKTHSFNLLQKQDKIGRLILCGKDMALPAIDEYVSSTLGIKTEVADVWRNLVMERTYIPPINKINSLDYAGAIGLTIYKSKHG